MQKVTPNRFLFVKKDKSNFKKTIKDGKNKCLAYIV